MAEKCVGCETWCTYQSAINTCVGHVSFAFGGQHQNETKANENTSGSGPDGCNFTVTTSGCLPEKAVQVQHVNAVERMDGGRDQFTKGGT